MAKYDGMILLELGTSVGSVDMVKYAKANGAYVIVSDIDQPSKSKAKQFADKTYMVSADDVDGLVEICKAEHVTAVASGVSEFIIQASRKVAEKMGLPVYYTADQWDRFMTKSTFREICNRYHVSTPATYYVGPIASINDITTYEYPVIIKPVDASSNAGISICYDAETLKASLAHASEHSKTGRVIVEQYVEGDEISCTYVIKDHNIKMVCMGTKYPYVNESGLRALSNAYIYPSPSIDDYMVQEDENVRRMFVEEGLNNCTVFIQGMCRDHKFYIFEAGLRMEGTGSYRLTSKMTGQNFLEFMVDNAMGTETDYDLTKEDPYFGGRKCVIFSQIVKGGKIAAIEGYDKIKDNEMIFASEQRRYVGNEIKADGTLRQIMFRYLIYGDSMEKVCDFIREIQQTVKAYDEQGNNMLVDTFDPNVMIGQ